MKCIILSFDEKRDSGSIANPRSAKECLLVWEKRHQHKQTLTKPTMSAIIITMFFQHDHYQQDYCRSRSWPDRHQQHQSRQQRVHPSKEMMIVFTFIFSPLFVGIESEMPLFVSEVVTSSHEADIKISWHSFPRKTLPWSWDIKK